MMTSAQEGGSRRLFTLKMENEGIDPAIIQTFLYYYDQILSGETGLIYDRDLAPVPPASVPDAADLSAFVDAGKAAVPRFVRIVLNGGLGTSMGLTGPKSLLKVKNGHSFLDIILQQTAADKVPLCLMNSFSTHADTCAFLERKGHATRPMMFLQHKFPKIHRGALTPVVCPQDPQLEWNPPGHGDLYISLHTSGVLGRLLARGIRYALISNADNLGASLDLALLGYVAEKNMPFLMEVAQRSPSDAKGGHLARHRSGRLVLRESAQCPAGERGAFRDIHHYRFFNTNNIWLNLEHLQRLIDREGMVRLPVIVNPKPLDPRREDSLPVYQVESAMGAAISLFEGAGVVCVPRSRFLPVKTCNDLLVLRSDRFCLTDDGRLTPNPAVRTETIRVALDAAHYKNIDAFDRRFSQGAPSLLDCAAMRVEGDVFFEREVAIQGTVRIVNSRKTPGSIAAGTVVTGDVHL